MRHALQIELFRPATFRSRSALPLPALSPKADARVNDCLASVIALMHVDLHEIAPTLPSVAEGPVREAAAGLPQLPA